MLPYFGKSKMNLRVNYEAIIQQTVVNYIARLSMCMEDIPDALDPESKFLIEANAYIPKSLVYLFAKSVPKNPLFFKFNRLYTNF